jgi:hypothetical protein
MSTGTRSPESRTFSSRDLEETYRPISALAVTSFVLGVLSILAFASMYLWAIPIVALVIAVPTSRWLERAREEYAGQLLAKVGILLAVLSFCGASTQYAVTRFIIVNEAGKVADHYVDLILAHRVKDAYFYTLPPLARKDQQDQVDALIDKSKNQYRAYLYGDGVTDLLRGRLAEAQVTRVSCGGHQFQQGSHYVYVNYQITLDSGVYSIWLLLQGMEPTANEWKGRQWIVQTAKIEQLST